MDLPAIQSALRERNIDAWLFYDHHHRDPDRLPRARAPRKR